MKTLSHIKKIKSLVTTIVLMIVIMACNQHKPESTAIQAVIHKPFVNVDVPVETFSVNPVQGATLCTQNGTKIYIAPESLLDEAGNTLKEPCNISFEQFHDMADILASGIPMSLTAGDVKPSGAFISAGMFKISGKCTNSKAIKIKSEAPIKVELASYQSDTGYSNYRLNEKTGSWEKTEADQRKLNPEWNMLKNKINAFIYKGPFADKQYFIFNTDALVDAYLKEDVSKIYAYYNHRRFPKALHAYGIQIADYPEDYDNNYTTACIRGIDYPSGAVVWKNVNGNAIIDKKNLKIRISGGKKIKTEYYTYFKITEKDVAKLELVDSKKNVIATYSASPVMSIKHLLAFSALDWKKKEKAIWAEIKKDEARLKFIAEFTRSFNISEFGIYNCDRINDASNSKPILAKISWPKAYNASNLMYYINPSKRFIISYSMEHSMALTIENNPEIRLLTVMGNNQILEISAADLQKAYQAKTETVALQFKPSAKIKTLKDLKQFLHIHS